MRIKHVAIQNAEVSKWEGGEFERAYAVHISLVNSPDRLWKHYFFRHMQKLLIKRKKVKIVDNEIRLILSRSEDIQSYIDLLKDIIRITDKDVDILNSRKGLEAL